MAGRNEEWKTIPGSRGQYEISTLGRVRNAHRGNVMKQFRFWNGSFGITLGGYLQRTYTISQLMGMTFYPDEIGRAYHINGIVTDNRLENIEVRE